MSQSFSTVDQLIFTAINVCAFENPMRLTIINVHVLNLQHLLNLWTLNMCEHLLIYNTQKYIDIKQFKLTQ